MLCIVGATAIATPGGLRLDWRILLRDVAFYVMSLGLLLYVLYDHKVVWWQSILLIGGYILYVITCKFWWKILRRLGMRDREKEPLLMPVATPEHFAVAINAAEALPEFHDSFSQQPKEAHSGDTLGIDYGDVWMHGFLDKKSRFYSKINVSSQQWQRRWFVLAPHQFSYCRNPSEPEKNAHVIALERASWVRRSETDPLALELETPAQLYVLRAKSTVLRDKWFEALTFAISFFKSDDYAAASRAGIADDEVEPWVWAWPEKFGGRFAYIISFPFKALFFITIPDVRQPKWTRFWPVTFVMSIVWLAGVAYGMVICADRFSFVLGIPPEIMGLTVTAAGTSLPNLFSSVIAARQRLGDMAVANAFGSNTFNIFVGMGLPWLVQTCFVDPGSTYPVESGAIFSGVIIMAGSLMAFIVVLIGLRMRLGHFWGFTFFTAYVAFVIYEVVTILKANGGGHRH